MDEQIYFDKSWPYVIPCNTSLDCADQKRLLGTYNQYYVTCVELNKIPSYEDETLKHCVCAGYRYGPECESGSLNTNIRLLIESVFLCMNFYGLVWSVFLIFKSKLHSISTEANKVQLLLTLSHFLFAFLRKLDKIIHTYNMWIHSDNFLVTLALYLLEGASFIGCIIYMLNIWLEVISSIKYFRVHKLGRRAKRFTFVIIPIITILFFYGTVIKQSFALVSFLNALLQFSIMMILLIIASRLAETLASAGVVSPSQGLDMKKQERFAKQVSVALLFVIVGWLYYGFIYLDYDIAIDYINLDPSTVPELLLDIGYFTSILCIVEKMHAALSKSLQIATSSVITKTRTHKIGTITNTEKS